MTPDPVESTASAQMSAAQRFLLPSVRDTIFLFLFWSLLAGPLSNRPLADPDIGWHIRTGEMILARHALPRVDPFSSTMQGQPWFAWEWLYDLMLGIVHGAMGLNGVVWLAALLIATTFALLLWQLIKSGTDLLLAIALMLLAEAAATIHLFARPHIVSWLFTLLWFIALERWEQGSGEHGSTPRWLRWFFPVSMLLWVNLHGAWIFGLALLALYCVAAWIEAWRGGRRGGVDDLRRIQATHRARAMGWAWAASALATLVNPYGLRLHSHIYRYLGDRYLMGKIAEFQSPNFHGWAERCFALILVATLMAFAGRRHNLRTSHILATLLAVYAGLLATRNLPVSSMLLVLVAGPIVSGNLKRIGQSGGAWGPIRRGCEWIARFGARMGEQELAFRGHLWAIAGVVAAFTICLHGGHREAGAAGTRPMIHAAFDATHVPVAAAEFLAREPSRDPVFSTDTWGGYLIYRLYPQRQVIIDDRHDLYGAARVSEILSLMQGEPAWRQVLEKWHIRTLVLPPGSTLASLLREVPAEWTPVYEDKVAVVFEKVATEKNK